MGNSLPDTPSDPSRSNTPTVSGPQLLPPRHIHTRTVFLLSTSLQQGKDPHAKVFEGLCGPAVTVTQQVRDQAARDGKCSNCLNWKNKKYPPHQADQCPYTTLDCVERLPRLMVVYYVGHLRTESSRSSRNVPRSLQTKKLRSQRIPFLLRLPPSTQCKSRRFMRRTMMMTSLFLTSLP